MHRLVATSLSDQVGRACRHPRIRQGLSLLAAVSLVVSWVLLPTQVEYNRLAHEWQVAASNDPRMREMLGEFDPAANRRMTLISQVGGSIAVSLVPFGVLLFLGRPSVQRQVERWD